LPVRGQESGAQARITKDEGMTKHEYPIAPSLELRHSSFLRHSSLVNPCTILQCALPARRQELGPQARMTNDEGMTKHEYPIAPSFEFRHSSFVRPSRLVNPGTVLQCALPARGSGVRGTSTKDDGRRNDEARIPNCAVIRHSFVIRASSF